MSGYVRRFTSIPPVEVITQIEGVVIVDGAPQAPLIGAGTGTVLAVGETEDGPFATDEEAKGAIEVFGGPDFLQKFGGLGYGAQHERASARIHQGELWNGNLFLKLYKLKCQRLLISRVDTSVGNVSFDAQASIGTKVGPYVLAVGQTLAFTTDVGSASSPALTAVRATVTGASAALGTIASGDTFGIRRDGGQQINIVFGGGDTTQAAVLARINATLGTTAAVDGGSGQISLLGDIQGTAGSIQLIEVTAGVLAKLGLAAGITPGTGTFGNISAVSATELAAFISGNAGLGAVQVEAVVAGDGSVRFYNSVSAPASTILLAAGAFATAIAATPVGSAVSAVGHAGGSIPAGTRVRTAGGLEWVTMQTLDIPAGELGPYTVKVRPSLDNGTAVGTASNTATVLVDPVDWTVLSVRNASALTAALTEDQIDARYKQALDATLNDASVSYYANYLLIARRSDYVVREGRANQRAASENGLQARIYVTGDQLGATVNQAVANVALFRSDGVFYTSKGMKVAVAEIKAVGRAGGVGFTDDGVVTVRPDGPLTTLCAMLPPEENPGQQTGLIDDFFEVNSFGEVLNIDSYKAYKRAGIAVPRLDQVSGMVFQSGVTSSLESGREDMARRRFANFIQDSAAVLARPWSKKLNTQLRRDALRGKWEAFLSGLKSEGNQQQSRLEDFSVEDGASVGNTPAVFARGIYYIRTVVRTYNSMNDIVFLTEIGPSAVITREAA